MFTPGWAGVLGKKVPSVGGGSDSGDSSTGTSPPGTGTQRDRRLADYSDSDAADSDWDTDDSHREATPSPPRIINVPGSSKPGGTLAAQLATRLARKEELSVAATEGVEKTASEPSAGHVAASPSSPKSPTNPLAARVAQAAASSIIPPPEHFLTATIELEIPSPQSPSSPKPAATRAAAAPIGPPPDRFLTATTEPGIPSPQSPSSPTSKGRRRASTADDYEPSIPLTSAITSAEPQLLKPSEMRGRAGLGSQRVTEETSAAKMTSATSVAARAEAFQKIVDASAEKVRGR